MDGMDERDQCCSFTVSAWVVKSISIVIGQFLVLDRGMVVGIVLGKRGRRGIGKEKR